MIEQTNDWKALTLLLKNIAKAKGITQQMIANKTGIDQPNIARFFSFKTCPTIAVYITIAKAIGITFTAEDNDNKLNVAQMLEEAKEEINKRYNY